jgi:glycopeptide antibiotics resistance protein
VSARVVVRSGRSRLAVALFAIYLVLLTWLVVWKLHAPYLGGADEREIKLIPFVATAGAGANSPFEVFANFAIFVPFGLCLGLVAPSWRWWKAAGAAAGVSLTLEAAQYVLAVGKSDITDVLVNTAGALAGFGVVALARNMLPARAAVVLTRVLSIATVLVLVAVGLLAANSRLTAPPRPLGILSTQSVPGR